MNKSYFRSWYYRSWECFSYIDFVISVYMCTIVVVYIILLVYKYKKLYFGTHIYKGTFKQNWRKNSWFKWSICQVCRYHYQQKNIFISTSTSIQTYSFLIKRFIIHMYTGIQTSTRKLYKILSTCKFYEVSVIGRQHLLIQPPNVTLFFSVCNVDTLNHKK